MADIHSGRKIVTTVGDNLTTYEVNYHSGSGGSYYHVLSGFDTQVAGTPQFPAHQLGVVSQSPWPQLPAFMIPDGMEVVGTFDHEPTREELDMFIPEDY